MVTIPPNTTIKMQGYLDKELLCKRTPPLLQSSPLAPDNQDLDIEPQLYQYRHKNNEIIDVNVFNVTTRTISIPHKGNICELQPVTIQPTPHERNINADTSILDKVDITKSNLTEEELQRGKDLILAYTDIFSKGDHDVGHTGKVEHRIDLLDDRPFKQRYRRIPPLMYGEVRAHIRHF